MSDTPNACHEEIIAQIHALDLAAINHKHQTHSPSTNLELKNAIAQGTICRHQAHLLTADSQSLGRGQHGRTWHSPNGNLYLSLYLPSSHIAKKNLPYPVLNGLTGLLSLLTAQQIFLLPSLQAIAQRRQVLGLPKLGVKWVNDLGFYDYHAVQTDKSQPHAFLPLFKLAGILIEPINMQGTFCGAVIGVGINLQNAPKILADDNIGVALSELSDLTDVSFKPQDWYLPVAKAILGAVLDHHIFCPEGKSPKLNGQFIAKFNQCHVLHGKYIAIMPSSHEQTPQTPTHIGRCLGINSDGSLQLDGASSQSIISGRIKIFAAN